MIFFPLCWHLPQEKSAFHLLYRDKKLDTAHSTHGREAQGSHPSLLTVLAISTYPFPKVLTENQSRLLFSICRWWTFHINCYTAVLWALKRLYFFPASQLYANLPQYGTGGITIVYNGPVSNHTIGNSYIFTVWQLHTQSGDWKMDSCLGKAVWERTGRTIHLDCISLSELKPQLKKNNKL